MIKKNASVFIMLLCMAIPLIAAEDDGCGGNNDSGGEPCTTNADCPANFICDTEVNECAETCADDSECLADEECKPSPNNGGNLCYIKEDVNPNNNPGTCLDAATDCPADGQEYFCNNEMNCEAIVEPADVYQYILIEDVSTETCGGSDPGSDIYFVRVLNSDGDVAGYGIAADSNLGEGDDNAYISPGTINGEAPAFRAGGDECPDTFADSGIYAMGCGGDLLINFLDSESTPINLDATMTIEVGEYGQTCNDSDGPQDEYIVKLCTDTVAVDGGSNTSCTSILGSANGNSGLGSIQVTLP